ncbi:MAG: hypothetical protein R2815_01575 [Flavobacteriales bacterium]
MILRPLLLFLILAPCGLFAQDLTADSTSALSFVRSVNAPRNAVQLFDSAVEAWTWTFGKEPGAKVIRSDRNAGVIEGTARVNFRSEQLVMREESMGTIQYRIMITVHAGECRVVITELVHSGNRNTQRGGVHLGLLTRSSMPVNRIRGQGRSNVVGLYADVKQQASDRITTVLQTFASRVRAQAEP